MNRIKTFKYKTNNNDSSASVNSGNGNHNSPIANNNNGILTKISKRYSTFSAKIIKRQSPGRKNVSPQKVISGSYNMTGSHSDDHRLEIGAPVLISTTQIDVETLERKISEMKEKKLQQQTQATSSGSETEIFSDAVNTLDIKFKFLQDSPELVPTKQLTTPKDKSPQSDNTSESYYETPTIRRNTAERDSLNSRYSKSVNNLCKSEIKVYLQKAPSLSMGLNSTTANLEHCHDLPITESEYCTPRAIPKTVNMEDSIVSKSVPTSPYQNTVPMQSHYMSVDSLSVASSKIQKSLFSNVNNKSVNTLDTLDSSIEEFDLKSVSCQSLNNPNLMESLDEIDAITRQIREAEERNSKTVDLDLCSQQDNIRSSNNPKSKNSSKFLNQKKDKINHAWSGLKHWIGEEKTKFNKAMQKQAALQRVGANDSSTPKRACSSSNIKVSTMSLNNKSVIDESLAPSSICDITDAENNEECTSTCMSDHLNGGGTSPTPRKNPLLQQEGQNGFDELLRYVKQGGEFGRELLSIMEARVDSEQKYAKSLSQNAAKLNKACRDLPGSIAEAWRSVATEMESRSEAHRVFSSTLEQEIVKPMEEFVKSHRKTRKSLEDKVDKAAGNLTNCRTEESKSKKTSHNASRENEKLQDAMLDVRIQKSPSVAQLHQSSSSTLSVNNNKNKKDIKSAEKDYAKLEIKRSKAEEAVKRADIEYYSNCLKAERARVDWELAVMRSSTILQTLENQRLTHMKNYVTSYLKLTGNMNPAQNSLVQRLTPLVENCNIQKDLNIIKNLRRISEGPSEQLLPDFYCEHTTLAMNRERRKQALIKLLQLVKTDLERERRSRNGLKEVAANNNQTEIQINTNTDKLYHIRSILTYLEGARFKLHSALLELDHKPRTSHPLSSHIQITRDRTGMQQSILKVPLWLKNNDKVHNTSDNLDDSYEDESQATSEQQPVETSCKNDALIHKLGQRSNSSLESSMLKTVAINYENTNFDRGVADGGSNQPDSDFDEFSSQEDVDPSRKYQIDEKLRSLSISENDDVNVDDGVDTSSGDNKIILSKCKALYEYTPKCWDELELSPGDIIEVYRKQTDGWWEGDLVGKAKSGIFPATYVEEFF